MSKKTHFQNHHPGPTIHPSPQAWLAGSKRPRWRVSLQDDDSESAFFWDTLHIIHKILEASISENNQIKFIIFTDRNILAWGGAVGGRYTGSCWGQVHCIALLLWHTGGDPSFNVKFDSIEDVRHRTALKRIHSDVTHIQTEDLKGRSWYRRECIIPPQLTPRHRNKITNNSHQLLPRITS